MTKAEKYVKECHSAQAMIANQPSIKNGDYVVANVTAEGELYFPKNMVSPDNISNLIAWLKDTFL